MTTAASAIPMFDYVEQYQAQRDEIHAAIAEVLASGSLILGPRVRAFEHEFARYLSPSGGDGVGVGNGTDALAIALRALEIGPGDEVITVANTAIPTVSAIRMVGATPVFCEIDPCSLLMDVADVERRITPRTRAIVPVHLYGNAVNMGQLLSLARPRGLAVVEDCAQSCGTTWGGKMTGTLGDIGCFSFYPTKNLGAYGDGGFCFTRNPELAEAMRQLRAYGCATTYHCQREGVNSRLDELQAAILSVKLRYLDDAIARRWAIAAQYREHLSTNLGIPQVAEEVNHSYHLFVVTCAGRAQVIDSLKAEGIACGIHYPTPIHRMHGYAFLGYGAGALNVTERFADQVLSLPCFPELRHEDVRRVCSVINHAAGKQA